MKPRRERKVYYLQADAQNGNSQSPMIRLAGKFLHRFGFYVGQPIYVDYELGKITITGKELNNGRKNE